MKKPSTAKDVHTEEVKQALDKTDSFAAALDQVFKKIAVAELLLMAAMSHYDGRNSLSPDRLREWNNGITSDLLSAKRKVMDLKIVAKSKSDER